MTVYTELLEAGVPLDHHESDLYAKVTDKSREIVERHKVSDKLAVSTFTSNFDGSEWFDIPFAYTPFWEAKAAVGQRNR